MKSISLQRALKYIIPVLLLLLIILFIYLWLWQPDYYRIFNKNSVMRKEVKNKNNDDIYLNVSRINGGGLTEESRNNPINLAVAISQQVYPATFGDNKPGAVILARVDKPVEAALAVGLIHHPIDAPILYINQYQIPELTLNELKRLEPEGVVQDGNVQVYLVGDIDEVIVKQIDNLGFKARTFKAENVFKLGEIIDQYKSIMHADHTDDVIIGQVTAPEYYISALPWIAHMGSGFLLLNGEEIPEATIKALSKRPQDAFIYLMGPPSIINEKLAERLVRYGHVQRIPGQDIYGLSAAFAGYKDVGPNFAWWIDESTRSFGWGVAEAGHNFIFGNIDNYMSLIPASVLAHRGKHGPLLLTKSHQLPDSIQKYLKTVQPSYTGTGEQLFNNGWVIGETIDISVIKKINSLLEIKRETSE